LLLRSYPHKLQLLTLRLEQHVGDAGERGC
jgi:hypothetical protein